MARAATKKRLKRWLQRRPNRRHRGGNDNTVGYIARELGVDARELYGTLNDLSPEDGIDVTRRGRRIVSVRLTDDPALS